MRPARSSGEIDEGLAWTVNFLARKFSSMRGEAEPSDVERKDALTFDMSRRREASLPLPQRCQRDCRALAPLYRGCGTPLLDGPHFPNASPAHLNRVCFSHCEKP